MKKKFNKTNKSLLKSVERAKKLKDLELAKSLEITSRDEVIPLNNPENPTPKIRSDLPKE
mgnify:CR=1 FL=1